MQQPYHLISVTYRNFILATDRFFSSGLLPKSITQPGLAGTNNASKDEIFTGLTDRFFVIATDRFFFRSVA